MQSYTTYDNSIMRLWSYILNVKLHVNKLRFTKKKTTLKKKRLKNPNGLISRGFYEERLRIVHLITSFFFCFINTSHTRERREIGREIYMATSKQSINISLTNARLAATVLWL